MTVPSPLLERRDDYFVFQERRHGSPVRVVYGAASDAPARVLIYPHYALPSKKITESLQWIQTSDFEQRYKGAKLPFKTLREDELKKRAGETGYVIVEPNSDDPENYENPPVIVRAILNPTNGAASLRQLYDSLYSAMAYADYADLWRMDYHAASLFHEKAEMFPDYAKALCAAATMFAGEEKPLQGQKVNFFFDQKQVQRSEAEKFAQVLRGHDFSFPLRPDSKYLEVRIGVCLAAKNLRRKGAQFTPVSAAQ